MLTAIEKELYKARKYERHVIGCDYCMVRKSHGGVLCLL